MTTLPSMFDRTITVEQRLWRLSYTLMVRSLKFNHDSDNKLSFLFVIYKLENPFNARGTESRFWSNVQRFIFFNENYITIRNIEKTMGKIDEWKIIGIIDRSIRIFVRNDCRKKYGGKKFLNLLKPSHQILIE